MSTQSERAERLRGAVAEEVEWYNHDYPETAPVRAEYVLRAIVETSPGFTREMVSALRAHANDLLNTGWPTDAIAWSELAESLATLLEASGRAPEQKSDDPATQHDAQTGVTREEQEASGVTPSGDKQT